MSIFKMRIYFLGNDNLQTLNELFKSLYITSIITFEENLKLYKFKTCNNKEDNVLIFELIETLAILKDPVFESFFFKLGSETLEKIRNVTVIKHTDKCIIRAVFDILFKYTIDFEYNITHLCCDNAIFKSLQIEILRDLQWKIVILNQIQN
jgi:hypothetical protein